MNYLILLISGFSRIKTHLYLWIEPVLILETQLQNPLSVLNHSPMNCQLWRGLGNGYRTLNGSWSWWSWQLFSKCRASREPCDSVKSPKWHQFAFSWTGEFLSMCARCTRNGLEPSSNKLTSKCLRNINGRMPKIRKTRQVVLSTVQLKIALRLVYSS